MDELREKLHIADKERVQFKDKVRIEMERRIKMEAELKELTNLKGERADGDSQKWTKLMEKVHLMPRLKSDN